jgi:hypothetical protein
VRCPSCAQILTDGEFHAEGEGAMDAQVSIVQYSLKMMTIRKLASYGASLLFLALAAVIIVFGPESRTTAANIVAGALLILALGIAGFTRFRAKGRGYDLSGSTGNDH